MPDDRADKPSAVNSARESSKRIQVFQLGYEGRVAHLRAVLLRGMLRVANAKPARAACVGYLANAADITAL